MRARPRPGLVRALCAIAAICAVLTGAPGPAAAEPTYAAMVMDARTGEVLHARNADLRLHPASLTKMMTLYVVFQAVEAGEVGLDDRIRISRDAASEPPSKLGLAAGQTIRLRHLIRGAAIKSANDAATALGEAVSGSEEAFVARMNRTAAALGMDRTTFRNAHGLTQRGHLSTARDMTTLGRRLLYDHPQYYHLFSRLTADAGVREVSNTNRKFLRAYRGADGIKTGYTHAAGFNLVASAERGPVRIVAALFGGRSTATRNARMAELLDMGFERAPAVAAVRRPAPPDYAAPGPMRLAGAPESSMRPLARPGAALPPGQEVGSALVVALASEVGADVASRRAGSPSLAPLVPEPALPPVVAAIPASRAPAPRPAPAPAPAAPSASTVAALSRATEEAMREIVRRPAADAPRGWGIALGQYGSEHMAERVLLSVALTDVDALDGSMRQVTRKPTGFEARFLGLTRQDADRACRSIRARGTDCETIGG